MKKEELDVLGLKKSKEGKSYEQIKKEIFAVDNSCRDIKSNIKLIEKQSKEIEKLNEKIEKQSKQLFDLKLERDSHKKFGKELNEELTLTDLKNIICTLKLRNALNKKEIKYSSGLKESKVVVALHFLKRNNIIEEKSIGGAKKYSC